MVNNDVIKNEFCADMFMYNLYFVRKNWNSFDDSDKDYMLEKLDESIDVFCEYATADMIIDLFRNLFCNIHKADIGECSNLVNFYAYAQFFGSFFKRHYPNKRKVVNFISETDIKKFLSISECMDKCAEIICHIYRICPETIKDDLHDIIDAAKSEFSYDSIVFGLKTGALNYDSTIRKILKEKIVNTDFSVSSETSYTNPGYILAIMYLYGFVTRYELEKYEDVSIYNNLLSFLLYPDYIPAEKEWNFLKQISEYRKYFQDEV